MKIRPDPALTYDDVLLVPQRSSIRSRSAVSTTTKLTPNIPLAIPIISANMDTVTEAAMGIAMAQQGGIGVLHRFMTIEQEAACVKKVKRAESFIVESPLTISPQETVLAARQKMAEAGVGGLIVTSAEDVLLGMVTTRDVLLAPNSQRLVQDVMTPRARLVTAKANESFEVARQLLYNNRVEKLPLVDAQDRVVGLITAQDIIKFQELPHATRDEKGHLRTGAAVGVRAEDMERAAACVQAGADVLVVDIAHGHSDHVINMVKKLKQAFPHVPVIAGNVAAAQGVRDLAEAGADAVKVGVGPGSICTTRIVTGFGVPQLTAVMECSEVGRELGVPVIADGGIKTSGDLVKALAAGASTAMLGNLLAGTAESPGAAIVREGRQYKVVRGMASLSANVERKAIDKDMVIRDEDWNEIVPEGVEAIIPYRGPVADVLHQLVGGLRSGLSYAGATTIEELWDKAEFVRITPAGQHESGSHDVNQI